MRLGENIYRGSKIYFFFIPRLCWWPPFYQQCLSQQWTRTVSSAEAVIASKTACLRTETTSDTPFLLVTDNKPRWSCGPNKAMNRTEAPPRRERPRKGRRNTTSREGVYMVRGGVVRKRARRYSRREVYIPAHFTATKREKISLATLNYDGRQKRYQRCVSNS